MTGKKLTMWSTLASCWSVHFHISLPTIMDKSSWDTPRTRPVSLNACFFNLQFHISTPSPLFNVVTMGQCPRSVFQHWKREEGGLAINKKDVFWNYRRTPIESVCFAQMCQPFCPWLELKIYHLYSLITHLNSLQSPCTQNISLHNVKYIWNNSYLNCGCRWKWRMIIAVNFPI